MQEEAAENVAEQERRSLRKRGLEERRWIGRAQARVKGSSRGAE